MEEYFIYFDNEDKRFDFDYKSNLILDVLGKELVSSRQIYESIKSDKRNGEQSQKNTEDNFVYLEYVEVAIAKLNKENLKNIQEVKDVTVKKVESFKVKEKKKTHVKFQENWGLEYLGIDKTDLRGDGVKVAVIDSGVDLNHPDFIDRIPEDRRYNVINHSRQVQDYSGHGTHVAGILFGNSVENNVQYGVAPNCDPYIIKAISSNNIVLMSDIIRGIDVAIHNGCKIINISAGASVKENEIIDFDLNNAVEKAWEYECVVVAAVGNDSSRSSDHIEPINKPSNCPKAIAVSAINSSGNVYVKANRAVNQGQEIDFIAPGVDILSAYLQKKTDNEIYSYALLDGTSMATPFISGIIALYYQGNIDKHPSDIIRKIKIKNILRLNTADVGLGLPMAPK